MPFVEMGRGRGWSGTDTRTTEEGKRRSAIGRSERGMLMNAECCNGSAYTSFGTESAAVAAVCSPARTC